MDGNSMPDGPAAKAASPSLAEKNLGQLRTFAAARDARSMTATQGPQNKGNAAVYKKNTIAPRSG